MIVIFQSESEAKSIKKVERVLDSFANRIGRRSWMTAITQAGLETVHRELRKIATKNTAVSCLLVKGRLQTELLWIVGQRNKFDSRGNVPVNETGKTKYLVDEDKWNHMPIISSLVGMATLWHDVGKCSDYFQNKLKKNLISSDPLRHEWVSCMMLSAYIKSIKANNDEEWLNALSDGNINYKNLMNELKNIDNNKFLFCDFDKSNGDFQVFYFIAWLILSHHRFPYSVINKGDENNSRGHAYKNLSDLFKSLYPNKCGYQNINNPEIKKVLKIKEGKSVFEDSTWLKEVSKFAKRLIPLIADIKKFEIDNSFYEVLMLSRCALVLGDHYQSSLKGNASANDLLANCDKGKPNQTLIEHLIGVEKHALKIVNFIPYLAKQLPYAYDIIGLKQKGKDKFSWQNKAVEIINKAKAENEINKIGSFVVNMASTGCGKTLGNAKILYALSDDDSLRCSVLLGLRTLTLQTGNEYKQRLGINKDDIGIVMGSKSFIELANNDIDDENNYSNDLEIDGIESFDIPQEFPLKEIISEESALKMLHTPILVSTIDQIIKASEKTKGGHNIIPMLRLLSSDIVIDEVDDYSGSDLIAVGRLIYLCGVFGRKVIISSATIPPEVSEGFALAYQRGWSEYATLHGCKKQILSVYVDEFSTSYNFIQTSIDMNKEKEFRNAYRMELKKFVEKRIINLKKIGTNKIGEIVPISDKSENGYFEAIDDEIKKLHNSHWEKDIKSDKKISFGLIRFSNIKQCIKYSRHISKILSTDEYEFRFITYHAREVMIIRHEQEAYLDKILCRKNPDLIFEDEVIRNIVDKSRSKNIVFIVISSPIEELGRDHDFSWAIIEPASYRSIIQTAGRVLRHRNIENKEANIGILKFNWRYLNDRNEKACYYRPGYEDKDNKSMLLTHHELDNLIDKDQLKEGITAIPRIDFLQPSNDSFIGIEHKHVDSLLGEKEKTINTDLVRFYSSPLMLTALSQKYHPFRKSSEPLVELYLLKHNYNYEFCEKTKDNNWIVCTKENKIAINSEETILNVWKCIKYEDIIIRESENKNKDFDFIAKKYGSICFQNERDGDVKWTYTDIFGLEES